eukprot:Hpha_TRINITY_DN3102_c0_g1::TRINITY_DN3102_c0_g1_i1::g.96791::m.96791
MGAGDKKAKRGQKGTWKQLGRAKLEAVGLLEVPTITPTRRDPWARGRYRVTARCDLLEPVKKSDPKCKKKDVAMRTLASLPPAQVEVWTDGAVKVPRRFKEGTAAYAIFGQERCKEGQLAAGSRATSYIAEVKAATAAIEELFHSDFVPSGAEVRLVTDCQ